MADGKAAITDIDKVREMAEEQDIEQREPRPGDKIIKKVVDELQRSGTWVERLNESERDTLLNVIERTMTLPNPSENLYRAIRLMIEVYVLRLLTEAEDLRE